MAIILCGVVLRVLHNLVLVRVHVLVPADDLLPWNITDVGELLLVVVRVVLFEGRLGVDKSLISGNAVYVCNATDNWLPGCDEMLAFTRGDVATVFLDLEMRRAVCE